MVEVRNSKRFILKRTGRRKKNTNVEKKIVPNVRNETHKEAGLGPGANEEDYGSRARKLSKLTVLRSRS